MKKILLKLVAFGPQLRNIAIGVGVVIMAYAFFLPSSSDMSMDSSLHSGKIANATQIKNTVAAASTNAALILNPVSDRPAAAISPTSKIMAPEASDTFKRAGEAFLDAPMEQDFSECLLQLRNQADQGNVAAEYLLAHAYESGEGVPKNMEESLRWYSKAAETSVQSHSAGSEPVPSDLAQAVASYQQTAEAGDYGAQLYLAMASFRDQAIPGGSSEAVRLYKKAVARGSISAENNLAVIYLSGNGVPKDGATGVSLLRKAAERGSVPAQYNLGRLYLTGDAVSEDFGQAAIWLRKAAEKGNAPAQVLLSQMYASGTGVRADVATAYMWMNLASTRESEARECRDKIEKLVSANDVAEGQKLAREWILQHPGVVD